MITIATLLMQGTAQLQSTSPTPRLDAEVLLGKVLGLSRLELLRESQRELDKDQIACFQEFIARRINVEPVAYIVGHKEFFGLDFEVNSSVLVPRPDTEVLVEEALRRAMEFSEPIRIIDLGTGSGCIVISVIVELKRRNRVASALAIDVSAQALCIARGNAQRHGVESLIEFRHSDWFSAVGENEIFDIVLANPPYIAEDDLAISPELVHEPKGALYAANNGRADIESIIEALMHRRILPKVALIETGASQTFGFEKQVSGHSLGRVNARSSVLYDLAGMPRVLAIDFSS